MPQVWTSALQPLPSRRLCYSNQLHWMQDPGGSGLPGLGAGTGGLRPYSMRPLHAMRYDSNEMRMAAGGLHHTRHQTGGPFLLLVERVWLPWRKDLSTTQNRGMQLLMVSSH